jgi:hypothetical protein
MGRHSIRRPIAGRLDGPHTRERDRGRVTDTSRDALTSHPIPRHPARDADAAGIAPRSATCNGRSYGASHRDIFREHRQETEGEYSTDSAHPSVGMVSVVEAARACGAVGAARR